MSLALDLERFVAWFQNHNGQLDATAMGFADFPVYGRGAVALRDIPVGAFVLSQNTVVVIEHNGLLRASEI